MSTLSVAMCTYNGSSHLEAQLASIGQQRRLPDELIVCDDASRDNTIEIVEHFSATAPFPIHLFVNKVTLGSTQNFAQAVGHCTGDLIALADQDDYWLPDKLARCEQALIEVPDAGFVFSDAMIVDQSLASLGYSLWDAIAFDKQCAAAVRCGRHFELLLKRNIVTGASLMFRAQYKTLVLPFEITWVHDGWIAILISAVASCTFVEHPLLKYRQHAAQQIGERKRNLYQQYVAATHMKEPYFRTDLARFTAVLDRLNTFHGVHDKRLRMLADKIAHCKRRWQMRTRGSRRLPTIVGEALRGRYRRYSLGWKSIAQDVFL